MRRAGFCLSFQKIFNLKDHWFFINSLKKYQAFSFSGWKGWRLAPLNKDTAEIERPSLSTLGLESLVDSKSTITLIQRSKVQLQLESLFLCLTHKEDKKGKEKNNTKKFSFSVFKQRKFEFCWHSGLKHVDSYATIQLSRLVAKDKLLNQIWDLVLEVNLQWLDFLICCHVFLFLFVWWMLWEMVNHMWICSRK